MTAERPATGTSRIRDAAATRAAILLSAVTAFTRHGYDGVGVREIAEAAGVTAMLVNRYFGSKENLFAEVVDTPSAPRTLPPGEPRTRTGVTAETRVARTAPPGQLPAATQLLLGRRSASPRSPR